jgi:molecular chaperone GrpE (heat shock protein)
MADETKTTEEEAMSQPEFIQSMAEATGVTKQGAVPDDASDEKKSIAALEQQVKLLNFQNSLAESLNAIRTRYPKATDAQIQKYTKTNMTGDFMGNLDAMDAVVRTTIEAEQDDDGTQTLEMVESESSGAGNDGAPTIAGNYDDAIAIGLGQNV